MRKMGTQMAMFGVVLALAGCAGGTPECGSEEVKDNLNDLADTHIANAVNGLDISNLVTSEGVEIPITREDVAAAITERLSYNFGSIRTTSRDEATDTYQCTSNLVVTAQGTDVKWEREFVYEVYSVEDADADYETAYDEQPFQALSATVGLIHQQYVTAEIGKVLAPHYLKKLQEVRDAGLAGTQAEREVLERFQHYKLEVPAITDAQQQRALEEMRRHPSPQLFYSNVPQDIIDAAEARQQQAFQEQQQRQIQEEEEAMQRQQQELEQRMQRDRELYGG